MSELHIVCRGSGTYLSLQLSYHNIFLQRKRSFVQKDRSPIPIIRPQSLSIGQQQYDDDIRVYRTFQQRSEQRQISNTARCPLLEQLQQIDLSLSPFSLYREIHFFNFNIYGRSALAD